MDGPRSPLIIGRSAAMCIVFLFGWQADAFVELWSSAEAHQEARQSFWGQLIFTTEVETTCLIFACMFGLHLILCLFEKGRQLITFLQYIRDRFLLAGVLFALTLL
jgi:hypothetical protein